MPPPSLSDLDAYGYFRLGLATGLVERSAPIAWADRQIMSDRPPTAEILELSLSTRQPYSQLIRLLTIFHPSLDYDIPICLLLARAGLLLESGRQTAVELILGLRLLLAEAHIPALLRGSLVELDQSLQDYRAGQLSQTALADQLAGVLSPYEVYREWLAQIDG
jgi:hypothetical protein